MRHHLGLIVLVLELVSLSACTKAPPRLSALTEAPPRNVVWIVIDTLRADHTGFMGYEVKTTPKLDAFAEKSLMFTQAISQAPWTKPSVATMFTSTYPHQHGALKGLGLKGDVLRDELITVAEVLQEAGYATAAFQVNPSLKSEMNFDQGFDVYRDGISYLAKAEKVNSEIKQWLPVLKRHKYFLYIQYMDAHLPYRKHAEYPDLYGDDETGPSGSTLPTIGQLRLGEIKKLSLSDSDKRYLENLYDGEIRYLDEQIGQLLEEFDDRTMIIITSDHGEEFWDHGDFEHGQSVYDELIRVPLLVKIPGYAPEKVDSQVRLMDLAPTILDFLGISIPGQFRGRSLLDTLEHREHRGSFTEATLYGQERKAYRTGKEKVIFNVKDGTYEVYDIERDPLERDNIEGRGELQQILQLFSAEKTQKSERRLLDEKTKRELRSLGYIP